MKQILLAVVCLLSFSGAAQEQVNAKAYSRSLIFYPTTTSSGSQSYILNFSTFDSKQDLPLFVPPSNGQTQTVVSSEMKQQPGSEIYSTAYILWQGGFAVQDGRLNITFPTRDVDRNRIRDMSQPELTFYTGATGRSRGDWPSTNLMRFEARLSRPAGQLSGAYSGFLIGSNSVPYYRFTGELGIMYMEGSMSYERGPTNVIYLTLVRTGKSGIQTTLVGNGTYAAGTNSVVLSGMRLWDEENRSYQMRTSTLSRKGNQYVGNISFVDGDLDTPWPDYTDWVLELYDYQDNDGNGIPDFSDPQHRPPVVTFTVPTRAVRVSTLPITLRGTASDMSGVSSVEFRIENGDSSTGFGLADGTTRWSIPVEALAPGTNIFWVRAIDALGHTSAEVGRKIIYTGE